LTCVTSNVGVASTVTGKTPLSLVFNRLGQRVRLTSTGTLMSFRTYPAS
jgi:hypothetical protein